MAFKSKDLSADDSGTSTITFTTDGTVVIGATVANTSDKEINVDVKVRSVYLLKNGIIPQGSALSILDGKIIVNQNDVITVTTDSPTSTADLICSYLEV